MKALIQAGGKGTRLRPITYEIPKPLVPIKKKPIVNHIIEFFARCGVDDIALLVSEDHRADFVRWEKAWKDEFPKAKISIFHEDTPRGTFGGLPIVADWIGNETFLMTNGDDVKDFDLQAMLRMHQELKPIATMALFPVERPSDQGVPVREGHYITEFLEKPEHPPSNLINMGVYILEPEVLAHIDSARPAMMIEHDVFPKLAKDRKLVGYEVKNGRWFSCDTIERWEKAMREW